MEGYTKKKDKGQVSKAGRGDIIGKEELGLVESFLKVPRKTRIKQEVKVFLIFFYSMYSILIGFVLKTMIIYVK